MSNHFKIGSAIPDSDTWDALPMGSTLLDDDGWIHTKTANYAPGQFSSTYVDQNGYQGSFHAPWDYQPLVLQSLPELQEEDSVPSRPTIDFSGSGGETGYNRATARQYASDLISRVNKGTTNEVLTSVAEGSKAVDAYALAEALLDASRHVATRFGQSMMRRRAGEKVAHLGYIAHAVLANHADGLPVYADGERSRKIETLEGEIAALKVAGAHGIEVNQSLAADLTKAREEARALRREVESLKRSVTHVQTERIHNGKVLDYAKSLLTDANRTKVEGFVSGLSAGRNTNWDV